MHIGIVGYGTVGKSVHCVLKDVDTILKYSEKMNAELSILQAVTERNSKYKAYK